MARALPTGYRSRPSNRWLYAATAGLLALAILIQVVRDRGWQAYEPATPILWFQSGPLLKRASLGFSNLLADVYWIRAVVYYGSRRQTDERSRNFDLLDPLLTFVTTLDPYFRMAYRFGAIFLTEAYPSGPGLPDRGIALLERGLAASPNAWEYMHDIGFIHYWWLRDYQAAAHWFDKGGRLPGAPVWLAPLAATTVIQGGDRRSARFLWRQIMATSEVEWFRRNAKLRLDQLDAMDVLDELNRVSQRFTARTGRPPQTWAELIASERLRGIPLDSTGKPFVLDAATGHIDVSRESELWPLPSDKPAAPPLTAPK